MTKKKPVSIGGSPLKATIPLASDFREEAEKAVSKALRYQEYLTLKKEFDS